MAAILRLLLGASVLLSTAFASLTVDLDDPASIKAAAALVAKDMLTFYPGDLPGRVPGILPGPPPDGDYYWWQGGAMWGTLLDYRRMTGDKSFDATITKAMLFQVGPKEDYNPPNWTASMGNDDQAFWALAAMTATETGYTDPAPDQPQWLALVQAVFNEQTHSDRRAPSGGGCDWGLRWQVYPTNNGYNYINTISNACYFNLGARLARYTGNQSYAELASRTWDWLASHKYVDTAGNYAVIDGAGLSNGCTELNAVQYSYNIAMLIHGAAFMYNQTTGTNQSNWERHLWGMVNHTLDAFFINGTAYESSCESVQKCNTDMVSYKGFMHRWLAQSAQLAPFLATTLLPVLRESTRAAAAQCTGGANGRMCGFHWSEGVFDNTQSASNEQNVLAALSSVLVEASRAAPVTNASGGTSQGNPNAGSDADVLSPVTPITTADRAGAAILTAVLLGGAISAFLWMSWD